MAPTNQEPLFLSNDRAEVFVAREQLDDNPELQSRVLLLDCLDAFDEIAELEKAPQRNHAEFIESIRDSSGDSVKVDKALKRRRMLDRIAKQKREEDLPNLLRDKFFESDALLEHGDEHLEERMREANQQHRFRVFSRKFSGEKKAQAREDFRQELKLGIKDALKGGDPEHTESLKNRESGSRPHKSDKERKRDGEEQLWTWGRLDALMRDPRARFFPATHREKNTVLSWLDYLDNPQYELGVNNQLFEVIIHQQKGIRKGGEYDYERAVESIAWEIGDYAADAARAVKSLRELEEELAFTAKDIKIGEAEEVADSHPGYAYLFRHLEIHRYYTQHDEETDQKAETKGDSEDASEITGRELLLTAEDRWLPGDSSGAGKHKTVHSRYTHPTRAEEIDDRFEAHFQNLEVKKARWAITDATVLEQRRLAFMIRRLLEIAEHFESRRGFDDVTNAVQKSLNNLGSAEELEELLSKDSDNTDRLLGRLSIRAQSAA